MRCISVSLSVCLSVSQFVCLSLCLFVCLSLYVCIVASVSLSLPISVTPGCFFASSFFILRMTVERTRRLDVSPSDSLSLSFLSCLHACLFMRHLIAATAIDSVQRTTVRQSDGDSKPPLLNMSI